MHMSVTVNTAGRCSHSPPPTSGSSTRKEQQQQEQACSDLSTAPVGGSSRQQQQQLDAWLQGKVTEQQQQQPAGLPGRYTLFVLPDSSGSSSSSSSSAVVVGRSRHAWLTYQPSSALQQPSQLQEAAAAAAVRVLSCCFGLHSSAAALDAADSLPVSAAGHTQLSFSLLHADPLASSSSNGAATAPAAPAKHYSWDFDAFEQQHLAPIAASLSPVSHISIESQVLHFTPARTPGSWSKKHDAYVVNQSQLPFFVDSDWPVESGRAVMQHENNSSNTQGLVHNQQQRQHASSGAATTYADSSTAAGVLESHVLHFLLYIPAADKSPLLLLGPKAQLRDSSSFWIPSWGGVLVLNLANETAGGLQGSAAAENADCADDARDAVQQRLPWQPVPLQQQHYQHIAAVVIAQLQALFGVAPGTTSSSSGSTYDPSSTQAVQLQQLPAGAAGFTQWQIDALLRQRVGADVQEAARVLGSLSRLVQQLPNLEMPDLIGQQVRQLVCCGLAALWNADFVCSSSCMVALPVQRLSKVAAAA
jgi:phosphatidylinositol glycan class S